MERNEILILGGASALSFFVGAGSSFLVLRKKIAKHYGEIASQEIAEARKYYKSLAKKKFNTPAEAVEALISSGDLEDPETELEKDLRDYSRVVVKERYRTPLEEETERWVEESKLFPKNPEEPADDLPPEEDVPSDNSAYVLLGVRNPEAPYVITKDKFFKNDLQHEQLFATYWREDKVVSDHTHQAIHDVDDVLGINNLKQWESATEYSGEKGVIYVRNERLNTDFEVALNEGAYGEIVMGEPAASRGEDE